MCFNESELFNWKFGDLWHVLSKGLLRPHLKQTTTLWGQDVWWWFHPRPQNWVNKPGGWLDLFWPWYLFCDWNWRVKISRTWKLEPPYQLGTCLGLSSKNNTQNSRRNIYYQLYFLTGKSYSFCYFRVLVD